MGREEDELRTGKGMGREEEVEILNGQIKFKKRKTKQNIFSIVKILCFYITFK